jgi:hypothetical protein
VTSPRSTICPPLILSETAHLSLVTDYVKG